MSESSQKMYKLLDAFDKAKKFSAIVSMSLVCAVVILNGYFTFEAFVIALFFTWFLHWILNLVLMAYFKNKIFGKDATPEELLESIDEFSKELEMLDAVEEVEEQKRVTLTVENMPEKPIGKFKDSDIFAWVDLEDEYGNVHRSVFAGTIDVSNPASTVPKHSFIVMPGIIYQVEGL